MDILPFLTALTTSATGPHRHDLAEVMTARADILSMSAQANAAVVSPQKPGRLSHTLRTALAARMARLSCAPALAAIYLETLDELNPAPSFTALAQNDALPEADAFVTALVRYADLVTIRPKDATQADIEALRQAGLTDAEIVHLAELIACVCYLSRLTLGMQALTGAEAATPADTQAPATDKHTDARAQERTAGFTAEPLEWIPYLQPVKLEDATKEQRDAMKITPSNTKISDYVLTLAHDPESLAVRSPLFNAIMYGRDGLSRAGREMGALGCSLINHCLYCASVHARRFIQLTKRPELVETLFSEGPDACLNDEYWQPIFDFSVKLTRTPATFSSADVTFLRDHGLSDLEIFDLICATGIFGWANRLMHTLGHSVSPP